MRKLCSFDQRPVFEIMVHILKMMLYLQKPFQPLHHDCHKHNSEMHKQSFGKLKQLQNTIGPKTVNQTRKSMCVLMMAFGRSWYFRNSHLLCEKGLSICGEVLRKKLLCTPKTKETKKRDGVGECSICHPSV